MTKETTDESETLYRTSGYRDDIVIMKSFSHNNHLIKNDSPALHHFLGLKCILCPAFFFFFLERVGDSYLITQNKPYTLP